ncbi:MAG: PepSY domain-containing protein [Oscillospiraceae bacterium]|nr:PepSY domain-containing protein [Oscillospiraceae bacterium]
MNDENTPVAQEKPKKKHSLWWLKLLLLLVVFAGGVLTGLKLSTMPLPYDVMGTLFPETRQANVAVTPVPTEVPATASPAPTATAKPTVTPTASPKPTATAKPSATPKATDIPKPTESAEPEEAAVPAGLFTPVVSATPAVTEKPAASATPEASAVPTSTPKATAVPTESAVPTPAAESTAAPEETASPENSAAPETVEAAVPDGSRYIGIDAALDAALKRAKVSESAADVYGVYKAKDDDTTVYVVSFSVKGTEYEYLINAATGEVEGWRTIRQEKAESAAVETPAPTAAEQPMISAAEAREIAFKHAGVRAADATRVSTELEKKDSSVFYEIEFRAGGYEYEYRIDAYTGDIRFFEKSK